MPGPGDWRCERGRSSYAHKSRHGHRPIRPRRDTPGERIALEVGWIAGRGFTPTSGQPLPLVLLGPQCAFRKAAISQLDAAGLPWRVAATSPSLAGLWASAVGGLGITVRTRLALPETLVWRRHLFSLPALEPFKVTLLTQPHAIGPSVERLRAIIGEEVAAALPVPALRRKRSASIRSANEA